MNSSENCESRSEGSLTKATANSAVQPHPFELLGHPVSFKSVSENDSDKDYLPISPTFSTHLHPLDLSLYAPMFPIRKRLLSAFMNVRRAAMHVSAGLPRTEYRG